MMHGKYIAESLNTRFRGCFRLLGLDGFEKQISAVETEHRERSQLANVSRKRLDIRVCFYLVPEGNKAILEQVHSQPQC